MSRKHLRFAMGFLVELLGLFLLNYHLREIRDGLSDGAGGRRARRPVEHPGNRADLCRRLDVCRAGRKEKMSAAARCGCQL